MTYIFPNLIIYLFLKGGEYMIKLDQYRDTWLAEMFNDSKAQYEFCTKIVQEYA